MNKTDDLSNYLAKIAGGYVPTHEREEVVRLVNATLKAERDRAVALLREVMTDVRWFVRDADQSKPAFNKARAFLAGDDSQMEREREEQRVQDAGEAFFNDTGD